MCIILTCEPFARPDFEVVEDCFYANPDGGGLMWCEDGRVQIAKGFADSQSLFDAIESAPIESRLVIHMRIATSGGIGIGTCHPFPICDRLEALHAPNVECDAALAHNGVIAGMPTNNELEISDTISFVQLVVNGLYSNKGITKGVCRKIKRCAPGNRFAIMTSDGTVYRLGKGWETVTKGIYASNSSWAWSSASWGNYETSSGNNGWSEWSYQSNDSWLSGSWSNESWDSYYDPDYRAIFDTNCGNCESKDACMSFGPACRFIQDCVDDWYISCESYVA